MRRVSIARLQLVTLLGLTVALAVVAGLGVGSLYGSRQRYEDALTSAYQVQTAAANLLAAGIVEEAVIRQARGPQRPAQERAAAVAFDRAAAQARSLASGDPRSERLLGGEVAAQERARVLARGERSVQDRALAANARAITRARRRRRALRATLATQIRQSPALLASVAAETARLRALIAQRGRLEGPPQIDPLRLPLAQARAYALRLTNRQVDRRTAARRRAADDSRRAVLAVAIAGGLALLAALALVGALIAVVRRPLDALVHATQRLAAGDLGGRVDPHGPRELRELGEAFNVMSEDLAAARAALDSERRRLAVIIESLTDALVVCDGGGRVVTVNPRARRLVPELSPGARVERQGGILPPLTEALDAETTVQHRGRTLAVSAAHLGAGDGGVVWTIHDATERARLERLKSEFVATASHELRSPLTSIKGFVELLEHSEGLNERQASFVSIILRSTDRLVDLVNDLLDVARIEADRIELHRRPIDLEEAITEVAELMGPRVGEKRQRLDVHIRAVPLVYADAGRVRQIFANLLTNAHLYTAPGGRISVTAAVEPDHIVIDVADTGRGMSESELEQVFERFYRGGDGADAPGTGLGLSIVRSLVDLHGGDISVRSRLGVGTTFSVRLPRARTSEELDPARAAIRGKRVLIVDDEPDVAFLIADRLAAVDVETAVVHSGDDALARLRAEPYDAVTLDILMPGMSGFEVLREIRGDEALRRIPVVFVSVYTGPDELADEWVVTKPIDADRLTEVLGAAVRAGRTRVLVVSHPQARERMTQALESLGIDHVWAASGADAARACAEQRFEVALVDAGLRNPRAALEALDLRGRRVRRAVIVFGAEQARWSTGDLGMEIVPIEGAAAAVLAAIRAEAAPSAGEPIQSS